MNQRLRQVVDEFKKQRKVYSDSDFARIIEIPRCDLSLMTSGKRNVSKRCVDNMIAKFPEINEEWFRTGEGEMLKSNSAVADNQSISIAGEEIKENQISVNTDATIASLIAEVAAQRRLTETALAEIAAQRKLTEAAMKQSADLIAKIG